MIRTRTSLRDRGLQMLGIARRSSEEANSLRSDALPDDGEGAAGPASARPTSSWSASAPGSRSEREVREAALRHTWEIENLLGAEAEAAVGGDSGAVLADVEDAEPLPAIEWIAPQPVAHFRPMPAPPPIIELESEAGTTAPLSTVPEYPAAGPAVPESPVPQTPLTPRPVAETTVTQTSIRSSQVAQPADRSELPADQRLPAAPLDGPVAPLPLPRGVKLTAEQQTEMEQRPDVQQKLVDLSREIQAEYDRILRDNISANQAITDWCHGLLAEARVIVTYRDLGNLARAEWCVEQVRARLDRAELSAEQGRAPVFITIWGILWFFPFVYLIFDPLAVLVPLGLSDLHDPLIRPEVFLRALYFGGLGGVAAIFYHLFKYVRDRSFDGQYVLCYYGKPFMGMILGALSYLTVFAGMRVLGLTPVGMTSHESEMPTQVLYMALMYVGALAIGFKENQAFGLLNRVITRLLGGGADAIRPEGQRPTS